jgi:hypothetical protein
MTRIEETKMVKRALEAAGYSDISVKHGRGTAYGWMQFKVSIPVSHTCVLEKNFPYPGDETCRDCKTQWQEEYRRACEVARLAGGRSNNDYGGNINCDVTILRPEMAGAV